MPLVFVHGIGNRPNADHEAAAGVRDGLFERFLFPVIDAKAGVDRVSSPMWGTHAGELRWKGASLVTADVEELGADQERDLRAEVIADEEYDDPHRILRSIAQRDLADAVDLLFSLPVEDSWQDDQLDLAVTVAEYCRRRETLHPGPDQHVRYPWLAHAQDDADLIELLLENAAEPGEPRFETLGMTSAMRTWFGGGLRRLRHHAVGAPVRGAVRLTRRSSREKVTELVGDVLTYLAQRGDRTAPGPIVRVVAEAIEQAARSKAPGQPLVVVAHSMGGNIMYDLLTHFAPDLPVDLLVTVGTQVGLFAELGLFHASAAATPPDRMPALAAPWINVVDAADILSYRVGPIVAGAQDYRYPSDALWAHSAYFRQPNFHSRLARRVGEALG